MQAEGILVNANLGRLQSDVPDVVLDLSKANMKEEKKKYQVSHL